MRRLGIKKDQFDWYVAITRGGLAPALFLSQITGCRKIDTICIESYVERDQRGDTIVRQKDFSHLAGQRVLVIDDLVDSGKTMQAAVQILRGFSPASIKTAVIYRKKCSMFRPNYYIEEPEDNRWINFPWELNQDVFDMSLPVE